MTFYREKTKDYFLLDTSVENVFIHEFMPAAPEKYVKVYLLALMHADLGASLSRHDIARHLGMEEEDVLKAWNYWEKAGVIRKHSHGTDDPFDYDVSFVNLRQQMYRYRLEYLKDESAHRTLAEEHIQITEAIRTRDEEKAVSIMHRHILAQEKAVLNKIHAQEMEEKAKKAAGEAR